MNWSSFEFKAMTDVSPTTVEEFPDVGEIDIVKDECDDTAETSEPVEPVEEPELFPLLSLPGGALDQILIHLSPFDIENLARGGIGRAYAVRTSSKAFRSLDIVDHLTTETSPQYMAIEVCGYDGRKFVRQFHYGTTQQMNSSPECWETTEADVPVSYKKTHVDTVEDGLVRTYIYVTRTCSKGRFKEITVGNINLWTTMCLGDWPVIWSEKITVRYSEGNTEEDVMKIVGEWRNVPSQSLPHRLSRSTHPQCELANTRLSLTTKLFEYERISLLSSLILLDVCVSADSLDCLLYRNFRNVFLQSVDATVTKEQLELFLNQMLKKWRDVSHPVESLNLLLQLRLDLSAAAVFKDLDYSTHTKDYPQSRRARQVTYYSKKRSFDKETLLIWLGNPVRFELLSHTPEDVFVDNCHITAEMTS